MEGVELAAWFAGSYLVGSIPFGLLFGKVFFGVDIREKGSGNLGATNAARILGSGRKGATVVFFTVVFLLDAAKGFGPAFAAQQLPETIFGMPAGLFAGAGAVAGHMASIYLKFKGGKGVAVSTGVLAALVPWPLLIAAGVWIAGVAVTRYVSVGSLSASAALPVSVAAWGYDPWILGACVALALAVVVKHRPNIVRLARGEENRIGRSRKKQIHP